jgi:hypothetical protein
MLPIRIYYRQFERVQKPVQYYRQAVEGKSTEWF